jgi:peptidoglycan/LPS O-acetylase OafA/YrhL
MTYPISAILVAAAASLLLPTLAGRALASGGFPVPDESRRLGCLDGLRGYLALSVMLYHFILWLQVTQLGGGWTHPDVALLDNFGSIGVDLFFMTSGFVFYPRILQGWQAVDWKATYISRVFRILPLQLVMMGTIACIILARIDFRIGGTGSDTAKAVVRWLACWDEPPLFGYPDSGRLNAYVLWSLRIEWMFYIVILPALALAQDVAKSRLPSWAVPLGFGMAVYGLRLAFPQIQTFRYIPLFAVGMLAYELRGHPPVAKFLATHLAALIAGAGLIIAAVLVPMPDALPQLLACGFFFACVGCGNGFGGIFATRGALVLGECSFGIYLLHGIVLDGLFVSLLPRFGEYRSSVELLFALPLAAVFAVAVSAFVYLSIERPGMRAGKFFAGTRRPLPSGIVQT